MSRKEWLEFAVLAIRAAETPIAIDREWSARLLIAATEAVQHAMKKQDVSPPLRRLRSRGAAENE